MIAALSVMWMRMIMKNKFFWRVTLMMVENMMLNTTAWQSDSIAMHLINTIKTKVTMRSALQELYGLVHVHNVCHTIKPVLLSHSQNTARCGMFSWRQ